MLVLTLGFWWNWSCIRLFISAAFCNGCTPVFKLCLCSWLWLKLFWVHSWRIKISFHVSLNALDEFEVNGLSWSTSDIPLIKWGGQIQTSLYEEYYNISPHCVRDEGIPSECPRFAIYDKACRVMNVANLRHEAGIPGSLPQRGDLLFFSYLQNAHNQQRISNKQHNVDFDPLHAIFASTSYDVI